MRPRRAVHARAAMVPVLLLTLPAAAAGQGVARNPLVASTCGWPSYEALPEPASLARIVRRVAAETDGYVAETAQDGLTELRRWIRTCDEAASRQAILELRRAYSRAASNPAIIAALSIALARGVDIQPPGATGRNFRPVYIQSNAEREVRRLLPQALEAWPVAALGDELAALALATRDEASLKVAAEALTKLSEELPSEGTVWTARAEIAIARREYDEAVEAARKAAELGDASGFHALGVARLLRDGDPAEGARMYFKGLASADAPAFYRYHEDIAPLLSLDEEWAWAALANTARAAWLRDTWAWRASTAGRVTADRLAVHFKRVEAAIGRYRRLAYRGARPVEALVWDSLQLRFPFDDRGLIYIRHGEPDRVVRVPSGRVGPGKEAWLYYNLADGRAVFEFRKLRDWADWVVAPPVECDPFVFMYGVGGAAGEVRYDRRDPPNTAWRAEFERGTLDYGTSLAIFDPELAVNAARCYTDVTMVTSAVDENGNVTRERKLDRELPFIHLREMSRRRVARARVEEALSTETAAPRFQHAFQALSSVYAFRGDAELVTVAAFLLLPAGKLTPRAAPDGVAYNLRLSLAIEDNAERRVQRLDTLVSFGAPHRLPEGAEIRTALQMPVTPVLNGTVRIAVVNADHPDEGQILVGAKPIPIYPPDALTMSDLVLAEPGPGTWRRGAVAVSPLPGHQIPSAGRFKLFYELYGARPNEMLRTRITIAPGTDPDLLSRLRAAFGAKRVIELSFEESAQPDAGGTVQVERTVTTSLEPGRYALKVTVDRSDGTAVAMETSILLVEGSNGG